MTDTKMHEALSAFVEAWTACSYLPDTSSSVARLHKAYQKAEEALSAQASAEPAAWLVSVDEHDNHYVVASLDDGKWLDDATNHGAVAEPLYTHQPRAAGPVVPEGYVLVKLTEISDGVLVAPEFSRLSNKAICETYSAGQRENYSTKTARHIVGLRAVERAAMLAAAPTSQSCSPTAQHADTATGHVSESANSERVPARWYMVNKDGAATLCVSQVDALKEAAEANLCWPHLSPHQAVLLGPVHDFATMVERGTKAWADTPGKWLEDLRGNDTDKAKGVG